jgi:hypothetical protein
LENELTEFFETIYGHEEGFVYVARKAASKIQAKGDWTQDWYSWPNDKEKLVSKVLDQSGRYEVYFGPALYKTRNAIKASIKCSRVSWVDFDGNAPEVVEGIQPPTIRVQSSKPGHEHWYWLHSDYSYNVEEIERLNRNLAYALSTDTSGWDSTQVLRPPGTTNHKRNLGVTVRSSLLENLYERSEFNFAEEAPEPISPVAIGDLPEVEDILNKYSLDGKTHLIFQNGKEKRSEALMELGYLLAEKGLENEEILTLLRDADERWGKFHERLDGFARLSQIVSIARVKYPKEDVEPPVGRLQGYGFLDLIKTEEIELRWVCEGLLAENGYLLIAGPSGIGKSQLSLDFACKAVLGLDFLDRPCKKDMKIGYLSMEMAGPELKYFVSLQGNGYSDEQLSELNERLILFPVGEPYYLNREKERDELEEMVHEYQLDGIIMDSLSSMVSGELTSEGNVKPVMDWNDKIRKRHNCFTWIIHHNRKGNGDNKKPSKLDDVFGSYLIPRNATTELTLVQGMGETIQCIPNKVRLSKKPDPFLIYRDSNLHFTLKKSGLIIKKKGKEVEEAVITVQSDDEFISKFEF